MARLPAALTVAMATGNVARAFGRRGGIVRAGEPADLAVLAAGSEAFVSPWLARPVATLIDGRPDLTAQG
jgi:cytosine/adenosine deaminase-related metal-dependent hydrolase